MRTMVDRYLQRAAQHDDPRSQDGSRRDQPTPARREAADEEAAGAERRATRRALRDWERLRRDGVPPTLTELAPHRMPVEWADRFLLACDPDPCRSVFVLCGHHVETAFGERLIGRAICDVAPRHAAMLRACAEAVRLHAPVEVEDAHPVADGRILLYRAAIMPVRGTDHEHGYLMGAYAGACVAP